MTKSKRGGARPGAGRKAELGPGIVRDVVKTLRLAGSEERLQVAAAKYAGAEDWGSWVRELANKAAARIVREARKKEHT